MRSAMQLLTRPRSYYYVVVSGDWRHGKVDHEHVWPEAVHRVAAEGISPEQAVDEAIARIKKRGERGKPVGGLPGADEDAA